MYFHKRKRWRWPFSFSLSSTVWHFKQKLFRASTWLLLSPTNNSSGKNFLRAAQMNMNFATWGHLMMSILPRYSSFTTFSSSLTATPDLFTSSTPCSTVKEHQTSTPLPRLELTGAFKAAGEGSVEFRVILVVLQWRSSFQTELWRGWGPSHQPRKHHPLHRHHDNKQNLTPHAGQHGEMKLANVEFLNLFGQVSYSQCQLTVVTSSSADIHKQHRRRWRSACTCSKVHTCTYALLRDLLQKNKSLLSSLSTDFSLHFPRMQMEDYKYISVLGRGHFGKVATHRSSPWLVEEASCGFPHSVECYLGIAGRI